MLKSYLADSKSGHAVTVYTEKADGFTAHLVGVATLAEANGRFKAETRSTAGTSIITSPDNGGAIVLTDIILTTDKTSLSSVTLQFTDGTNTVTIVTADSANAPVNLAIPLNGRWEGWKDARLELVTVSTVNATAAVGYYKRKNGVAFAAWDALR